MRRTTTILLALALTSLSAACDPPDAFDAPIQIDTFVRLESGLAAMDRLRERVIFLGVGTDGVVPKVLYEVPEGEQIVYMTGGPDPDAPDALFALTAPLDEREAEMEEALVRIDPAGEVTTRWVVGTAFGGLAFCPERRYAVMYHDGAAPQGFYNPNEVAVIDLRAHPSESNPRVLSIDIGGRTVEGVDFSPPMEIAGATRSLAVFLAEGLVKLVDLEDGDIGAVSVKLVTDEDPRTVIPQQILSRPADGVRDPMIFVRASGSQDVYAISLIPRADGLPGFWATLNQYEGGPQPEDIAVVESDGPPLLVVANSVGSQVSVIDVDTADIFTLTVEGSPGRMLLRGDPEDEELIIFGDQTSRIYFLATAGLAQEKGGNLEYLVIPDGIDVAIPLDEDRMFVRSQDMSGFALIDLRTREVTRLSSTGSYDWVGAEVFDDVFFVANPGDSRVVSLDLATGHPEPLVLDEEVESFYVFGDAGMGMVMHGSGTGRATMFPLASPYRDSAFVVDGLWLSGFLDGKEVQQ